MSENTQNIIEPQSITVPKGGGSISSLGETFKANAFTGSSHYSIPLPLPSARSFDPKLSIDYNSGSGNSAFGLGFSLSLNKITVSTRKSLPKYNKSDIYLVNGQEVVLKNHQDDITENGYKLYEYLPRVEGAFSTIKQYVKSDHSYWKIISSDNVTTIYGESQNAQVYNKKDTSQIFEWLIESMEDAKGNKALFTYKEENDEGIGTRSYEQNRACTQKYIKKIEYGNYKEDNAEKYAFHLVFDYGEYDLDNLEKGGTNPYSPTKEWDYREDAFSSYKSCFEIRTRRRCENILVFNHFENELGDISLVKRLKLSYDYTKYSDISILRDVIVLGYEREGEKATDAYTLQRLPPFSFKFSEFNPSSNPSFKELTIEESHNIPGYLNADGFQAIDLYGEGISGLLYSNKETLMYCQPLGDGKYAKPTLVNTFPLDKDLQKPSLSLQDLDGNGELQLVVQDETQQGYYQRVQEGEQITWQNYVPFDTYANDFINPNLENISLSGNGKSDLAQINEDNVAFYSSLGKKGFEAQKQEKQEVNLPYKKENYAQKLVVFSSFLGDGLSHRVKITKNSVQCWPNLGYGKFGEKITLQCDFDLGENFDVSRLHLADVDGSGTVDIVIVEPQGAKLYINQNGNTFSEPIEIKFPKPYSSIDQISFADVLGNGTSCLVFTKIAPTPKHYYYNFVDETTVEKQHINVMKPYLLNEIDNNMGAATQFYYASSTKFYLEDKNKGYPWSTKLPFPVQVVEKTVTQDKITHSRFSQCYAYHDGFYSHTEKAFKGFAFVQSWDSEDYESYVKNKMNSHYQSEDFATPVYTKTWYETGNPLEENFDNKKDEPSSYFSKDADAYTMPQSLMPKNMDTKLCNQAYEALSGRVIRTEVYGYKDKKSLEATPYLVTASNYEVKTYQDMSDNPYVVFTVVPRQSIEYHYEKDDTDPRITRSFVLETDDFTNPLVECSVALPRRDSDDKTVYPQQQECKILVSQNTYVKPLEDNLYCHTPWQTQSFEAKNVSLESTEHFSFEAIQTKIKKAFAHIIPYGEESNTTELALQQLSWHKTLFWNEDFTEIQPKGIINAKGLIHHHEEAVFSQEFIKDISSYMDNSLLEDKAGYFFDKDNNYWWNRGLVQFYDTSIFSLPNKTENSFVPKSSSLYAKAEVKYDKYALYAIKTSQYMKEDVSLDTTACVDYRVGDYKIVTDENDNQSQFLFDALGNVYVSSLVGNIHNEITGGMCLYDDKGNLFFEREKYEVQEQPANLKELIINPKKYLQGATHFFYYDVKNYYINKEPNCTVSLVRDAFYYQNKNASCKMELTYANGFNKELEKRVKYDDTKWSVTGQSVYNNKGNVVQSYLPYFSKCYLYSHGDTSAQSVAPTTMEYDALDRLTQTNTPKGFFTKTEFTPWEQKYYDENDTIKDSPYYKTFMQSYPSNPTQEEKAQYDALEKASKFYDTPTIEVFDAQGNAFLHIATKKEGENLSKLITYSSLDAMGRVVESIDPRLYESNQTEGTTYFNFKYQYSMDSASKDEQGNTTHVPILTNSVDAGVQIHLNNMYKQQLWSINSRDYCQLITYNHLQKQTELLIKNIKNETTIDYERFDLVEQFTYGEIHYDKSSNRFGRIYELKDLSGITVNSSYAITGEASFVIRQLVKEYQKAINWKNDVELEWSTLATKYTFNALRSVLSETIEQFTTHYTYNSAGQLYKISATVPYHRKGQEVVTKDIIHNIQYDANGNRTQVSYGNSTSTNYTYEDTTLNLIGIKTSNVQELHYTYDPVGNITQCFNPLDKTVYHNNQKVNSVANYTYDALYQLMEATGRQHPGVSGKSAKEKVCEVLTNINDMESLENYTQIYEYDNSGNLISKQHIANSNAYTVRTSVQKDSNRLKEYEYDAAGNLLQLSQDTTKILTYNCCNNLVSVCNIKRSNGLNDSDYYLYDSTEHRVRKVVSTYDDNGAKNSLYTKIYMGNYELTTTQQVDVNTQEQTLIEKKEMLRVMDGETCVAILYNFTKVKSGKDIEENTPIIKYQLSNNIHSVTIELDEEGKIITYEEYCPYGETSFMYGKTQLACELKTYRYSGKERDNSTGLYYYGRRYYSPSLSRWINADPAGTVDGLNLFAFVGGNPVSRLDIDGLMIKNIVKVLSLNAPSISEPKIYQKSHKSFVNNDIDPSIKELNIYIGGTSRTAKESFPNFETSNKDSYDMYIDGPGTSGDVFTKFQAKILGNGANGMEAIKHNILENKKSLENLQLINNKTKINIKGYSRGGVIGANIANSFAEENYKNVNIDFRDPVPGPGHNIHIRLNENINYRKQVSLNNTLFLFYPQEISGGNKKTLILSPGGHSAEARDNANRVMPEEEGIFFRQSDGSFINLSVKQAFNLLQDEPYTDFTNHTDLKFDSIRTYKILQEIDNNFMKGK